MAEGEPSRFKKKFHNMRDSGKIKDFLVFLIFVFVAAVFWFILTLNDEMQHSYDVTVEVVDVPDSVTFINRPPQLIHVTLKDRGMNQLKYKITGNPELHLKFNDYIDGNFFRVSSSELSSAVRSLLGAPLDITSCDPDSIRALFTGSPGKNVPIRLSYDVTVSPGLVLGEPRLSRNYCSLYSVDKHDTVSVVSTEKIVLKDIDKNTTVSVPLIQPSGKRVEPESIDVTFVVEQLVKKEASIAVEAIDVPSDEDILFFPSKVKVTYFVPVSRYSQHDDGIRIAANFNDALNSATDRVSIRVIGKAPYISKIELDQESVEYTIVKNM